MLSKADIETKLQEMKPTLTEKFHVSMIGYFGSYATGQQTDSSDLDLKERIKDSILKQVRYI